MAESLAVRRAGTSRAVTRAHEVLEGFAARYHSGEALTAIRHFPAREAQWADFPNWVNTDLVSAYAAKGIHRLYTHQAAAAETVHAGKNIVIVTPTASGKTLCYNLPVLNAILENPDTRALYLFPTKALAQDQLAELYDLNQRLEDRFGVFTYDGDTPADARKAIREKGHVVLTNPDMLHTGILPHHTRWTRLFENLRYIVLDELHTYRGVFGSHLCNVLRRLRRIARFYGRDPQFICCSATIANPGELASRLLESEVEVLDSNGAPAAEKNFVFYNPPVVNRALGIRRSYINESSRVAQEFLKHDLQTIVFANSRLNTELLLTYLQQANPDFPGRPEAIRGYRGGYLPNERREIERGLREGKIRGVVSTSALELGIDVGSLDTVVMAGYPGTIAATWQRAGRAGRRNGSSCAVLVASSSPLDQFMVRHPDYFFGRTPEHAFIQPDNLEILVNHLKCAAFELPIALDEKFGGVNVPDLCARLAEAGFLHLAGENYHWTHEAYPADTISLRSVSSDNFVIIDITGAPKVVGEIDFPSALLFLHEKAIYIHGGLQYHVEHLDFKERKAYVKRVDVDYYTNAVRYTQVRVLEIAATLRGGEEEEAKEVEEVKAVKEREPSTGFDGAQRGPLCSERSRSLAPSRQRAKTGFDGAQRGPLWPEKSSGSCSYEHPETFKIRSMNLVESTGLTAYFKGRSLAPPPQRAKTGLAGDASSLGMTPALPAPEEKASPSSFTSSTSLASFVSHSYGDVLVRSKVVGFKKIKFFTNETIGDGKLELPENEMHTTSYWITLERPLLDSLPFSVSERQSGMFGLLHALESVGTLLLMCDRRDLGTAIGERPPDAGAEEDAVVAMRMEEVVSTNVREFFEPNLYLYDAYPGGIGFSEPLFRAHDLLVQKTRELISCCECEQGCPSCIGPAGDLTPRAKEAALAILDRLCS